MLLESEVEKRAFQIYMLIVGEKEICQKKYKTVDQYKLRSFWKGERTFNSFDKANNLIYLFIFHYNFIRPHGSLNNCTPAEVAGFASDSFAKNSWFSAA